VAVALATIALAAPGAAHAQLRVAIIEVTLEGQLGPAAGDAIVAALASGLRPGASHVLSPAEVDEVLRDAEGVADPEAPGFAPAAGRALEAAALLRARVDQLEQLYTVEAELLLARDGSRLAATTLECAACTWDEALHTVTRAGQGLAAHLPGRLHLEVMPPEASVTVDEHEVTTDDALLLRPGTHRVVARHPGHAPQSRLVSIVAGGATSLSLTLHEGTPRGDEGTPPPPRSGTDPYWLSAWITLGASVAALVPGVLWLALDGRCPIDWNGNGTCPEVYDLWPQGLALTAVGAAALSASVTLFAMGAFQQSRRGRPVAVAITPTARGGGSFQVTGTF